LAAAGSAGQIFKSSRRRSSLHERPRHDVQEAIDPHPRGVLIRFEVAPGSARLLVPSGYNPWRKALEAKLTERPEKGRANHQLESTIADLFEIPRDRVQVVAGQKSSRKTVIILGVGAEEAKRRLGGGETSVP